MLRLFVCLLWLMASSISLTTEIYHWVDADGVHHYSDSRPPTALAPGQLKTIAAAPAPNIIKSFTAPSAPGEKLPGKRQSVPTDRAVDQRKRNCAQAEQRLRQLEHQMRRGYTARESRNLHQRKRELSSKVHQLCY